MVELVLDDADQLSILELELIRCDIPYVIVTGKMLKPPYLLVYGVPLDFERSLRWIKEHIDNE